MQETFRALVLEQGDPIPVAAIRELPLSALPDGDVLVRVSHSGLNYKDGMILQGQGRLVRQYPHIPGIDLAGIVLESSDPRYLPGDEVILTGWHVGETHWGGHAGMARVRGDWLTPLPTGLSRYHAMALGTAGFTAMLAVQALEDHGLAPEVGEVLVTGASGGVGSIATLVLARLGYRVAAGTGRPEHREYLAQLGATRIIPREELAQQPDRPLRSERWAGCVDAVGGDTLAHVLAEMGYGASVAACGLAGGPALHTSVLPFLLRGVNLLGIDSVRCPATPRRQIWERLAGLTPGPLLDGMTQQITLEQLPEYGARILRGEVRGRTVVVPD